MLKPGGTFCGCFYVQGEHRRTDWFVRRVYEKAGFFMPPYETVPSLKARLAGMYADVNAGSLKSIAWFVCRKGEGSARSSAEHLRCGFGLLCRKMRAWVKGH